MNLKTLYPPPRPVEIGNLQDDFPPVFEPVIEYQIPSAMINSYGYIFKNFKVIEEAVSYRHRGSVRVKTILKNYFFKKKIEVDRPAISILNGWLDSFYHFTLESLVKLYVLREHLGDATVVFHCNEYFKPFHKEWIEITGLKDVTYLRDDEILKTPLAISSTFTSHDLNHHNIIIPEFRNWILNKVKTKQARAHKNIFIGRRTKYRRLLNLEEVKNFLEERDFVYLEMENFNLEEQINIFRNAKRIVALHGAALTHLCFAQPNAKVLDLLHKDFYQLCYLKLSKILNIDYAILKCSGVNNQEQDIRYNDLEVDLNKLESIIQDWH